MQALLFCLQQIISASAVSLILAHVSKKGDIKFAANLIVRTQLEPGEIFRWFFLTMEALSRLAERTYQVTFLN